MRKSKKLFAVLLSVMMVLCMMPAMAFAADDAFAVTKDGTTTNYATAEEAVASVGQGEKATLELLKDYKGEGIVVDDAKNITFDLAGHTWEVEKPLVGSAGTETNAFQLKAGTTVTFKNGTVTSSTAAILFQSYCNLTVDGVDVELNTPGVGNYAMSNNNGKTVLTGDSTVSVSEGNYAMDSYKFQSYDGGDVVIEDADLYGDVEVANGGKLTLTDGGYIEGDVVVRNYEGTASSTDWKGNFIMNGGYVSGDVRTEGCCTTAIAGGMVEGSVTLNNTNGATASVTGGIFGAVGQNVTTGDVVVEMTDETGDKITVIGLDWVQEMLDAVEEVGSVVIVNVLKAPADTEFDLPTGSSLINNSGNEVVVNGESVKDGGKIEIVEEEDNNDPTTPPTDNPNPPAGGTTDDPADKDADKDAPQADKADKEDKDAPKTGDATSAMPFVLLVTSLAAAGSLIALRKREE